MGLFLQTVLFPGGEELKCHTAVQRAAEDPGMNIQLGSCRWFLYEKGPAVLMNDGCCGYEDLAEKLSVGLPCPVMVLFTYDGDYWGYFLWENGTEIDCFHSYPEYFGPGKPPNKPGNAALAAQIFGVERKAVKGYLIPWDKEKMGRRAYEGDTAVIGDCWQMADFMSALGFNYDLLAPQPDDASESSIQAPPSQTVPSAPPLVYRQSSSLRDSEELPNALTDLEYILLRAGEVFDVAQEAVQLIRDVQFHTQYKSAASLLTAAIQAHPDRAALYILRAFCWNQVEAYPSGRSRKPDMDQDMTKVLELEPDNVMALRARCPTAATTNRYKRHIGDLTRLIELDPEHWDIYLTSRAYRFHWIGDDTSARADLEELVRRRAKLTMDLDYLLEEFGLMELQAYPVLLREKYQKIMEKFTYEGKEPETKERLRYLFHNQRISVSSLSPEPEDWNVWTEECIQNMDWAGLCRVINQRGKGDMMPSIYGGYSYEKNFHCMLECFACGNIQAMERILPPELAQVKNCYNPLFPAAAHVLIGLWYKDKTVLEWAVPNAERFLERKKSNLLEKAMVAFLLDLVSGDMVKGSEDLLAVCKGYPRDQKSVLGVRPLCTLAHGLYCLAQILLPEDTFQTLKMPEYKNFLPRFALWRLEHPNPDLSLWFRYPEDMALLNTIYGAPPAKLVLWQPSLNSIHAKPKERQDWTAHGVKWVDNYVDELWDMGIGEE